MGAVPFADAYEEPRRMSLGMRRPMLAALSPMSFLVPEDWFLDPPDEGSPRHGDTPPGYALSWLRTQSDMVDRLRTVPRDRPVGWLGDVFFESAQQPVTAGQLLEVLVPKAPLLLTGRGNRGAWVRELVTAGVMLTVDPADAWRLRAEMGVQTVIVRTWGGIGDTIAMTPLIEGIARSASQLRVVVWALNEIYADVFDANPWVHEVYCGRNLKAGSDSLVFHPKAGMLSPNLRYAEPLVTCVSRVAGVCLSSPRPVVFVSVQAREAAEDLTDGLANYYVLHVASRDEQRNWPIGAWNELIARLGKGRTWVQLGAQTDPPVEGAVDLRGIELKTSFAVLKEATLFAGVDSALQHAAAAFRVPALVLFGPSAERLAGHQGGRTLRPPWCGCYRQTGVWRRCTHRCMAGLSVSDVEIAITAMEAEFSLPTGGS